MDTRREFILKLARMTALATVATTTGYLIFRNESKENCELEIVCNNCKKNSSCELKKVNKKK